jgi:DedD protein
MEKKKLLLVAVSVGVFLVIIISASILVFTPRDAGSKPVFTQSRPLTAGTGGTLPPERPRVSVDTPERAGGVRDTQIAPLANAGEEPNFYINGEQPDTAYTAEKNEGGASATVTINIPSPRPAAAVSGSPAAPRAPQAASGGGTARAPAPPPAKSATAAAPAAKPAAAKSPAKPAAAAPAVRPAPKKSDYWVQTGAFSTLVRAEGAKENLSSKGIASIIDNREVDGKTWYRVRVGPYTSETEANYWLSLVKSIDGFADSQVRQTTAAR